MNKRQAILLTAIMVLVVIIDQIIKVEVKTSMTLSEHIPITDWFHITFVENKGMAFGWSFGTKTFLSLFRVVTVALITVYVFRLLYTKQHTGFIVCLALIVGGAIGNIVDSLFYGMIFSESSHFSIAHVVPWGEGYGEFLQGKVVDMFYFPLIEWNMPDWAWLNKIPLLPDANEHCVFFSPVFNFADACISCGVVALILFFRQSFTNCFVSKGEGVADAADAVAPSDDETDSSAH